MFSLLVRDGSDRRFSFYLLLSLVAARAAVIMINAVAGITAEGFLLNLFIATPPSLSDLFAPCHTVIRNRGFSTALQSGAERISDVDPLSELIFMDASLRPSLSWASHSYRLTSGSTMISTRRLFARPSGLALSATGRTLPIPRASIRSAG